MSDQDDTDHLDIEDDVALAELALDDQTGATPGWRDVYQHLTLEQLLKFENLHPEYPKEGLIRHHFGMRATHYYQQLNHAIDTPEALAEDPALVKRLLNRRHQLVKARSTLPTQ